MRDQIRDFLRSGYFLLICLLILLVAVPVFVGTWFWEGHGASLSAFGQVRSGMSQQAVRKTLGNPTSMSQRQDGGQSWFYTRTTFCIICVQFDENGMVVETDHDH